VCLGRLYPNKLPVTAVKLINNDVLPTFEAHVTKIDAVLSDNGRESCGRQDHHPYELSCSSKTSSTSAPGLTGRNPLM
jgi:hypothetical protein